MSKNQQLADFNVDNLRALIEPIKHQKWSLNTPRDSFMLKQPMFTWSGSKRVQDHEDWGFTEQVARFCVAVQPRVVLRMLDQIDSLKAKVSAQAAQIQSIQSEKIVKQELQEVDKLIAGSVTPSQAELLSRIEALTAERNAAVQLAQGRLEQMNADRGQVIALQSEVAFRKRCDDAYKWGYGYLQDRMNSLGRVGWAHDCDSEIEARINTV